MIKNARRLVTHAEKDLLYAMEIIDLPQLSTINLPISNGYNVPSALCLS